MICQIHALSMIQENNGRFEGVNGSVAESDPRFVLVHEHVMASSPVTRLTHPAAGGQGAWISRSMSSPNGRSPSIGPTNTVSQSSSARHPGGGARSESAAAW